MESWEIRRGCAHPNIVADHIPRRRTCMVISVLFLFTAIPPSCRVPQRLRHIDVDDSTAGFVTPTPCFPSTF